MFELGEDRARHRQVQAGHQQADQHLRGRTRRLLPGLVRGGSPRHEQPPHRHGERERRHHEGQQRERQHQGVGGTHHGRGQRPIAAQYQQDVTPELRARRHTRQADDGPQHGHGVAGDEQQSLGRHRCGRARALHGRRPTPHHVREAPARYGVVGGRARVRCASPAVVTDARTALARRQGDPPHRNARVLPAPVSRSRPPRSGRWTSHARPTSRLTAPLAARPCAHRPADGPGRATSSCHPRR